MKGYNSIFIVSSGDNWILKILGEDIYKGFQDLGYKCRMGTINDYNGEDICFHTWWRMALPCRTAKVNAIFITHTDDQYKENQLVGMKDQFDLFFTMSQEDAAFLIGLGYDKRKVFGVNLPVRNQYIRPISIGIFSRCYPDHRKNELWLLDYCKQYENSQLVNFVFVGDGWGEFVSQLSKYKCSFEWHNVSRFLPCEYMFQQLKLANLDYYIYMGMDGGAMGTYDAYAMGIELCVTDDGYHKSIPDLSYKFSDKEGFFSQLDKIVSRQVRKIDFFRENTASKYVERIAYIINNDEYPKDIVIDGVDMSTVVKKRRYNYFPNSFIRFYGYINSSFYKWAKRKKSKDLVK